MQPDLVPEHTNKRSMTDFILVWTLSVKAAIASPLTLRERGLVHTELRLFKELTAKVTVELKWGIECLAGPQAAPRILLSRGMVPVAKQRWRDVEMNLGQH